MLEMRYAPRSIPPVTVPDVTGNSLAAATAMLSEANLLANVYPLGQPDQVIGSVVVQSPAANEQVFPQSMVTLQFAQVHAFSNGFSYKGFD